MNIKISILLRARIAFLMVVVIFAGGILYRMFWLQWVEGAYWKEVAVKNRLNYREVKATRGNIYSDNGSLLATSLPFYRVAFDPTVVDRDIFERDIDSLAYHLAKFFGERTKAEYVRKIRDYRRRDRRFLYLSRRTIDYSKKKEMATWPIFREGRMGGGVIFERVNRRFNPFTHLAQRTVGYMREDNTGGAGLEYSFNQELSGKNGMALFQKTAGGFWKPVDDASAVKPEDGYDIVTTIDVNWQDVAETALLRALEEREADNGCVVVMEVATGHIKAMANLGKNGKNGYTERYNYAVAGRTDPGSTFKLASYMALFEETSLTPKDSIETGDGEFKFYRSTLRDSHYGGFGTLTLKDAFAKSSNIAIAKLTNQAFGQNPQRFVDYIYSFGLGRPLHFQMIGEGEPYIKSPSDRTWSGITLPWMSVGYELQISPLQILTFYNAVANGGRMIRPIIVREVRHADKVVDTFETAVINEKICSDKTLGYLRGMLESVVDSGTASNIRNAAYKIAGKTGTSQKIENGRYTKNYYTSFAGYFPADQPKYSCIVVIDNPQNGFNRYAGDVAAPVFKEVADKIYGMDVELHREFAAEKPAPGTFPVIQAGYYHDLARLCNEMGISNHTQNPGDDWVRADVVNNGIFWKNAEAVPGQMPNVTGMTLRDALYILENRGVNVKHEGRGRVARQWPTPDMNIIEGATVSLKLEE
ncbi:cell division protein FtsI (penicillin-binding protein 3) [Catalinimonas alkaloidigena]|uniref:Cell division protein FtsI (Penicillin-binding protein 3) n=1 Tax=Catalinimonas alkaloidigena TaxID=1075417 RepID=A0A1G9JA92_9BACT|nr:penicillin-binding protein [Catalinimonas alkaloidigena]SDL34479.1 cell division protein FtsI (penicillin-binding protein 3) [Catalinimonas alkaloidigena]